MIHNFIGIKRYQIIRSHLHGRRPFGAWPQRTVRYSPEGGFFVNIVAVGDADVLVGDELGKIEIAKRLSQDQVFYVFHPFPKPEMF